MDRGTNYAVRDGNRMAEMIEADLKARPNARAVAALQTGT
jgi:hypothetical protein